MSNVLPVGPRPKYKIGDVFLWQVATPMLFEVVDILITDEIAYKYEVDGDMCMSSEFALEQLIAKNEFILQDKPIAICKKQSCECGAHSVRGSMHSTWCPLFVDMRGA